jgi:peptidoglycan hydrolase CwlO-like protein
MYNNPATLHVAYTTLIDGVVSWKEFISKVTCINMSSVIEDNNKLPNSEQSYKGKIKTHKYINRQNQSTTGKL